MTIERMFNNGMLTRRSTLFVFDEGVLLYEGTLGSAPLNLLTQEIVDVNIRYKDRRPVEVIIRISHDKGTLESLYPTIISQGTYFTLVNQGVTVYAGYYANLPKRYRNCLVKEYSWLIGPVTEMIIKI